MAIVWVADGLGLGQPDRPNDVRPVVEGEEGGARPFPGCTGVAVRVPTGSYPSPDPDTRESLGTRDWVEG